MRETDRVKSFLMLVLALAVVAGAGAVGYWFTHNLSRDAQIVLVTLLVGVLPVILAFSLVSLWLIKAIVRDREADMTETRALYHSLFQQAQRQTPVNLHIGKGQPAALETPLASQQPAPEQLVILGQEELEQ